ncbi:hypothetical protein QFC22_006205 [Naganishia vaughanmartiniae]|uniref:Uncharacterized protein n=1 Tax=Naganishia vaughanmartiniae TaxID=1424756 RepID=A0ACC2WLT5_9TREE|nr:hypothetical protein QFC22_006205 [Naganishia vaughanmartiniae]
MTLDAPAILGEPIKFPNGMSAPNRFLKSAMTERLCTYDDNDLDARGKPTPEYVKAYEEWGKGQIGVVVLGNIPVHREGLEAKKNAIIDKTSSWDAVEAFKPVIAATKAHGSLCIGQLTHGGRQVSEDVTKHPVSSSDVQAPPMGGMTFAKPRPLTLEEIDDLVDRWAYAAEVLFKAGADGAQLHGAHGYLLSQFLSSRVNKRTDDYGGPLENKSRIVFRIIDEIKKRVDTSKFILSMKLNSSDFAEGGFTDDESKILCQQLEAAGLDLIELSGGTYESMAFEHKRDSTKKREAYFIEFAQQIRPTLKKTVLCVTGGFRSAHAMAEAVSSGATQMVGLARPLTAEPYLCRDILSGKSQGAKPNKGAHQLTTGLSIIQIGAMSTGQPIPDLSDEATCRDLEAVLMGKKTMDEIKQTKPHEEQELKGYPGDGQSRAE